jgi:segregation and condensation protein B
MSDAGETAPGHQSPAGPDEGAETATLRRLEARRAIEAILMVTEQPIEPRLLAQLVELSTARVEELCAELAEGYEAEHRGFVLVRVAGGYRYQSHPDLAPYVERFVLEGQTARLSAAALETLAIVAYKQPLSRAQIAAIRGVNVDGVIRTLQQRGYIDEVARDAGPGQAALFGTTPQFLERLGLDSVADLPPLGEFVPGADVVEQLERTLRADPLDALPGPTEVPDRADDAGGAPDDAGAS